MNNGISLFGLVNLLRQPVFLSAITSWFVAQFAKALISLLRHPSGSFKEVLVTLFWKTGGMPSSHSALSVAITTSIAYTSGMLSDIFVLSFFFTMVLMIGISLGGPKVNPKAFIFEKGMFKVDYLNQELYFYHNAALPKEIDYNRIVKGVEAGDVLKIKINKDEPLKLELKSFVDSILEDKEIVTRGEDGLKALEIAQKIIESANKNEIVELK